MAKIIHGDRISKQGAVAVGCSVTIFDNSKCKLLLTRRADNEQWCLPGGRVEAGESVTETCTREAFEETGLHISVVRLIGIYSNPHRVLTYQDGNSYHLIALNFEAKVIGGTLGLSNETTAYGYFGLDEIVKMDVFETHQERIADAFAFQESIFIK
jgi:ADP-ribose pyrophosphatase YjhB (NUDIX family)